MTLLGLVPLVLVLLVIMLGGNSAGSTDAYGDAVGNNAWTGSEIEMIRSP